MAISRDILASYRGPRRVIARLFALGVNEGRALAILMGACGLLFVAQWPRLSREAFETKQELEPLLGGALLSVVIFLPLIFYLIAMLSAVILRFCGWTGTGYGARLALFWAFLACAPVMLLRGLVAGFVGPGAALQLVDLVWVCVLIWFWISGLREAGQQHTKPGEAGQTP